MSSEHEKYMRLALALARRGLGTVAPNPAVGCLLVKDGQIVGRGWTQPGGRPHAETEALAMAGASARGAIAYVTLEPCSHHGQTPPCADALIKAGVARVVAAIDDKDPRVSGRGLARLREAGIEVVAGILKDEAAEINEGFFLSVTEKRPLFSAKSATSIDGRIAVSSGHSKWITGPEARHYGHMLRAQHDAILIGIGTLIADDPMLDCRTDGLQHRSPVPVILDSQLRTPITAKLVKQAQKNGLLIICNEASVHSAKAEALQAAGVKLLAVADTRNLPEVAEALTKQGLTRVLIEGGGTVIGAFLKAGLCDRLHHFQAGKLLGGDGIAAIGPLGLAQVSEAPHLTLEQVRQVGADLLATYRKAE